MKRILITGWNTMRWVRMSLAIFIIGGGFYNSDWISVALGGGFATMTLLNVGCCGRGACATGDCDVGDTR